MATGVPGIRVGETLESFIDRQLRAPEAYRERMSQAVESIVRHLQHMPNYSIKEVVKSGSLGKGTTVGNNADADLVIFFNGYQTMEELIAAKPKIISDISTYMNRFDRSVFSACIKLRENGYLGQYKLKHIATNTFVEVDILPALDVVALRGSVEGVIEEMRYKPQIVRGHYSVCFCKEQLRLIRAKPAKVKDLIRLMKYWKNSNSLPIRSYCCEVVCLYVHDKFLGQQTNFNMKEGFNRVLRFLIETQTLHTVIDPMYYYNTRDWFSVFPTLQEAARIRQVAKQTVAALG
ncbi:hypothetical protein LOTGIDRAFT_233290 [Lottia gigantea]|uniref:2'-5'-oligoadenylate synthetase 1 domain-containing protein n=1 Tax=Lottia gigantea TaxID=225164 RepID=V4BSN0_LOTGI|nr:hypothetical protein LOTGIDRAFT_233290 [Lottia gigantea]ESO92009.1 hypothetical protein LOTGIDRAFT_233290 [Lottia gigantea]